MEEFFKIISAKFQHTDSKKSYTSEDFSLRDERLHDQKVQLRLKELDDLIKAMYQDNNSYELVDCDNVEDDIVEILKTSASEKGFKIITIPVTKDFIIYHNTNKK